MAGLKTFWILLFTLFALVACVPQTKQSSCASNEAFNSTLRTCVPVVGGPSSFIKIDDYTPSYTIARFKNNTDPIELSIKVSNPYNQSYSVIWTHTYNAFPNDICSNSLSCEVYATGPGFSNKIGIHIITAKIVNSQGKVVDSHNFELKINNSPLPIIVAGSVNPPDYFLDEITPLTAAVPFYFTIKNNDAIISPSDGYRTIWRVSKNGSNISSLQEIDAFPSGSLGPTDTHSTYYGTSNTANFNPATIFSNHGLGNYTVRAILQNNEGVIDEKHWYVKLKHPELSKIDKIQIYKNSTSPGMSTQIIAYNGISYNQAGASGYNFVPVTGSSGQANFCVGVVNGEGIYTGDGLGVKVEFYLDGSSVFHSSSTDNTTDEVCLSDAGSSTLSNLIFNNPTSIYPKQYYLTARVFDEASNQEYTSADIIGGSLYPIRWDILVLPLNTPPTVTFTDESNLDGLSNCSLTNSVTKTCTAFQDTDFTLGIHALDSDTGYETNLSANQTKFSYSMKLLKNGQTLSECKKEFTDASGNSLPPNDHVGPDYLCEYTSSAPTFIPSYDASGPVDPRNFTYSVAINFFDNGSDKPGATSLSGNTITYNFNVEEKNTAPTLKAQATSAANSTSTHSYISAFSTPSAPIYTGYPATIGSGSASEGDTVIFHLRVEDQERDDHQILIYKCEDSTCAAQGELIASNLIDKTNNALSTLTSVNFLIPQTFVDTSGDIYFRVETHDCPSVINDVADASACNTTPNLSSRTPPGRLSDSKIFRLYINNYNPMPKFSGTPNPLTSASLTTMVGYPLTIDPGTLTDTSQPASEKQIQYQWYVDKAGGHNNYSKITGATSRVLRWTPSNGLTTGQTFNLSLCVSDGTTANPLPADNQVHLTSFHNTSSSTISGPNCLTKWDITMRQNAVGVNYFGGSGDVGTDVAIWQDTTGTASDKKVIYSAYTRLGYIFVEKTVFNSNGEIFNDEISGFQTVSFPALQNNSQDPASVKDISLAGTATHLYIAYQAADVSTPNSPKIRVRRIDKSYDSSIYGEKTNFPHKGKFGFVYDDPSDPDFLWPTTNTGAISINQNGPQNSILVEFVSALTAGDYVRFGTPPNHIDMIASDTPAANELCSGSTSGCSPLGNAQRLAAFINQNTDRKLQGVTGFQIGTEVRVFGSLSGREYLDSHSSVANYTIGKLGKIMVIGSSWYLPFVDNTTASTMGQIRILRAAAGAGDILDSTLSVNLSTVYSQIGAVNSFTNDSNPSGEIVILATKASNSVATAARYNTLGTIQSPNPTPTLFGGAPVDAQSLRLATPASGNNRYFIVANALKVAPSLFEWNLGDCSDIFSCSTQFISDSSSGDSEDILLAAQDVSIQAYPNSSEARLMVNSETILDPLLSNLYVFRYKNFNEVTCGTCVPVNLVGHTQTQTLFSSHRVTTTKIDTNMTIGTAGATPLENEKDVMFALFPLRISTGSLEPQMGIFNVEPEFLTTSSTDDTGELGFRSPFVNDD